MAYPRRAGVLLAVIALLGSVACSNEGARVTTPAAKKNGSGELRTDTEPLSKRFAGLGSAFEARWMSGTHGDPDNPGPSTYWLDAVITLAPGKAAELASTYAPTATEEVPAVVDGLRSEMSPGPFRTSTDAAFAQDRWRADAYLDPASNVLVLVAQGT